MVNYRYDLKEIERNHEAYANDGIVAASRAVRQLLPRLAKAEAARCARCPAQQLLVPASARARQRGNAPWVPLSLPACGHYAEPKIRSTAAHAAR